jgi:hypothetical protein
MQMMSWTGERTWTYHTQQQHTTKRKQRLCSQDYRDHPTQSESRRDSSITHQHLPVQVSSPTSQTASQSIAPPQQHSCPKPTNTHGSTNIARPTFKHAASILKLQSYIAATQTSLKAAAEMAQLLIAHSPNLSNSSLERAWAGTSSLNLTPFLLSFVLLNYFQGTY